MTRVLAATVLLGIAAAPAFACNYNASAASVAPTTQAATQPADTQTPPPAAPPAGTQG